MIVEERFKEWLRPEGLKWWKDIKSKYGRVDALWSEGGIPHAVHFNEGMQVRNWMREQPEFKDKEEQVEHWFDDNWVEFVEGII